jgi:hypothetical protein
VTYFATDQEKHEKQKLGDNNKDESDKFGSLNRWKAGFRFPKNKSDKYIL